MIDVSVSIFVCFDLNFCWASDCTPVTDVYSQLRVHLDLDDSGNFDSATSIEIAWKCLLVIWNASADGDRCCEVIMTFLHSTAFDCTVDSAMESSVGNFLDYVYTVPQVIDFASTVTIDDDHCPSYVVIRTNSFVTVTFELSKEEAISIFSMFAVEIWN